MRRHILAAVDGWSDSAVVGWAAAEAELTGLPLRLAHAWSRPEHVVPGLPGVAEVRGRALAALAGAAERVRAEHPSVEVATALLDDPVPGGLLAAAEDADLVVVGPHRPGGLPGLFLGSVGPAVAARSPCPVVLLRGEAGRPPGDPVLVVGVKPTGSVGPAARFADREAELRQLTPLPLYVWAPPRDWDTTGERDRAATVRRELDRLRPALPRRLTAVAQVRPGRRPARALLTAAADARLLVLGRSGTRLGPVAREVCEQAGCPVVIVPHP